MNLPNIRNGIGLESHSLGTGRRLVLGGVGVPHQPPVVGHSDGAVLVHAIIGALLSVANHGDKGQHFPSADERYQDIPACCC